MSDDLLDSIDSGVWSTSNKLLDIQEALPTLRDQFAMAALTGLVLYAKISSYQRAAEVAYEYADAMMKAREVKDGE